MKRNNKGFTLAELLIVVAIIAVLVAIAIPTFGGQVERARETADAANLRAAYAEATMAYLNNAATGHATRPKAETDSVTVEVSGVSITQTVSGWTTKLDTDLPFTGVGDITNGTYTATFTFSTAGTEGTSVSLVKAST